MKVSTLLMYYNYNDGVFLHSLENQFIISGVKCEEFYESLKNKNQEYLLSKDIRFIKADEKRIHIYVDNFKREGSIK